MEQQLDVGVSALEGVAVVRPEGILDIDAAGGFEHQVRTLLRGRPAGVVIDLRGVTFLDSIGMRSLFRACFWCERQQVRGAGRAGRAGRGAHTAGDR